ncbi:glycoside hydrolase TIM-barrel-like domain-containing protein [Phaeobacter sp. 11ANDIMAR09]|uniref:baseplate multidomain protein megatron n=1 Tax=Phaeobacter sp. 11ANDIMAR09 TaxID=1225647 RepID=UPI0006C8C518|nr:glycoside hydrolase TIM-barrel-like domain-containing protein [Phaeobacter sp. 11ANDIMAR09]KPD10513.1 hypothetical protein AN476_20630 [Phaeobacter sp. 11ANDIMAR09]
MATILLSAAGAAIGGSIGGTFLGVTAAALGKAAGGLIGQAIDNSLFASSTQTAGPRLDNLEVQKSAEGGGLPVVEGVARVAGQVIWATNLEEVTSTTSQGGKGGGGSVETTEYSYYANFAVALSDCATGPIRHFGRIWADGKLLDTSDLTIRFYTGSETQEPDALMVAKDGGAPAYRGVSYVVFERMNIEDFGRRLPNLTFELWGPPGEMEDLIRGVDMIPGATEFGYSPAILTKGGAGSTTRENAIRSAAKSDWANSLDLLQGVLPACDTVALVVSWFGTDLRAAHCQIEPRVETKEKHPSRAWTAGGLTRTSANMVSLVEGTPAFGSAPDDQSIMDAIADLKARGLRVVLYPFVMMDIPGDNTLPDLDGNIGQATYPWRGRIGPASADGAVAGQISALVGTAAPGHFSAGSGVPVYSGPAEWSFRRFILHLAALARNAGGVDAFLIGSELVDLTMATDTLGQYPFVDALVTLAGDVKTMLPAAQISYAADWSEYHSHRVGGEVHFHLDPLWSSANVDFIGIDNYLPLSDWRPGNTHTDYDPENGVTSVYSLDYLKGQIEGGEFWDYYYASQADRDTQTRTSIWDGAHGENWVFRQKAIRPWHGAAHHNRPGGVRDAAPTSWVPGSKPVWFTEFGCPSIHLGTNQPNVFYDPKTSESYMPHYSSGARDDFMQRQYIRAMLEWWGENGGAVLSTENAFVWSWDARPWPEYPRTNDLWSDGPNWRYGHWLNGRAGSTPAAEVIERRLNTHYDYAPAKVDLSQCYGQADGMVLAGPMSFRDMMGTWETALNLDASEVGGVLRVTSRASAAIVADYTLDHLVEDGTAALYTITRTSQEETPRVAVVSYSDTELDYEAGAARATIREKPGQAEASAELALVSDLERMTATAQTMLHRAGDEREKIKLTLPPSSQLKPGDVFGFTPKSGAKLRFIADEIVRGEARTVSAYLYTGTALSSVGGPIRPGLAHVTPPSETALPYLLDLPILPGLTMADHQGLAAFHAKPWPGGVDLYRSPSLETGYSLNLRTGLAATAGETVTAFPPGMPDTWSPETLEVELFAGSLVSRSKEDVLAGANAMAVEHSPDTWEVLQFRNAELIGANTWRLSGFLRGQLGTEWARSGEDLAAGARVVLLDSAVIPVDMQAEEIGRPFYWRALPSGKDHAEVTGQPHAFQGVGRRPYSPCHLKAALSGGGLSLSWIRRTRIEGDAWTNGEDVPLGEAFERYRVEIGPEAAPLITETVADATSLTGLDASALSGLQEIRVSQVSETYGPGTPARLSLVF